MLLIPWLYGAEELEIVAILRLNELTTLFHIEINMLYNPKRINSIFVVSKTIFVFNSNRLKPNVSARKFVRSYVTEVLSTIGDVPLICMLGLAGYGLYSLFSLFRKKPDNEDPDPSDLIVPSNPVDNNVGLIDAAPNNIPDAVPNIIPNAVPNIIPSPLPNPIPNPIPTIGNDRFYSLRDIYLDFYDKIYTYVFPRHQTPEITRIFQETDIAVAEHYDEYGVFPSVYEEIYFNNVALLCVSSVFLSLLPFIFRYRAVFLPLIKATVYSKSQNTRKLNVLSNKVYKLNSFNNVFPPKFIGKRGLLNNSSLKSITIMSESLTANHSIKRSMLSRIFNNTAKAGTKVLEHTPQLTPISSTRKICNSVNEPDPNSKDPQAYYNNPTIYSQKGPFRHFEYHSQKCDITDCQTKRCPKICSTSTERTATAHFTHGNPPSESGKKTVPVSNTDLNGNQKTQKMTFYDKPHATPMTPEHAAGTQKIRTDVNMQNIIDQHETKK